MLLGMSPHMPPSAAMGLRTATAAWPSDEFAVTKRPPAAGDMLPVSLLPLRSREERVDERIDAGDNHSAGRAPVAQHGIRAWGSSRHAAAHRCLHRQCGSEG